MLLALKEGLPEEIALGREEATKGSKVVGKSQNTQLLQWARKIRNICIPFSFRTYR